MADSRVGIVVVTHNRLGSLRHTLARLAELPERPAVVVVDNASTDGTAATLALEFPAVRVIRLSGNRGASARLIGVSAIPRPYVAFADDDSWWAAGALGRAADLLDAHPQAGVIAARVLVGADEREDPTCAAMATSPLLRQSGLPGRAVLGFIACGAIARRAALLDVGRFPARWHTHGEETLLAVDMASRGWSTVYIPELVAYHHPSATRDTDGRHRLEVRNRLWFAWLRRPLARSATITFAVAAHAARDANGRRGVTDALRGLGWILRDRRVVSSTIEQELRSIGV